MLDPRQFPVRSAMSSPAIEIAADAPLRDAFTLMRAHHIQHLCVVRQGKLVGILSEQDLHRAMPSPLNGSEADYRTVLESVHVDEVMSRTVLSVGPELALSDAMSKLTAHRLHALPVVERGQLVGILTGTDCLTTLTRQG